jgi:hypothetical protein
MSSEPKNRFNANKSKVSGTSSSDDKGVYKNEKGMKELFLANLNFIASIFLTLSIYYYIRSLKGCFDTQAECLKNLNEGEVRELLSFITRSGFILSAILILCLYKYTTKLFMIVISIIYGYLCFYYDTGANLDYHGSYNRFFLLIVSCLWFFGMMTIVFIYKAYKRFGYKVLAFILSLVSACILAFVYTSKHSCDNWSLGLKDTRISFDNMPCTLSVPQVCYIDILGNMFDYSRWLGDDCQRSWNGQKELYDKIMKKNNPDYIDSKLFGYPRTEVMNFEDSIHLVYDIRILDNMIDMMDPKVSEDVKKKTEVMIDFREEKSKVIIKIHRDEELVKLRQSYYLKFGKHFAVKNTMIIYIDAISRTHFFRTMKKTVKWIEKFYKNNDSKLRSYQFLKYHSLGYFTEINTIPAFIGKWWLESGGNYYVKYFKDIGAMTADVVNPCGRGVVTFYNNDMRYLNWGTYDHHHSALFCDPNYNQADNPYTPFLGPYSVRRRCLHGKDVHDYQLEYGYKFWETYSDMPKLLRMQFIDAHEGSLNVVKYLDDKLEAFLTDMENKNMLDDTAILFMADHGNNMPGFISMMNSEDYAIEKYLPMMFMIVPNSLPKEIKDGLAYNEQSFVTPWDIHSTLLNISGAPQNAYNPYGTSLFKKIPGQRFDCNKFRIRQDYCVCKNNNNN